MNNSNYLNYFQNNSNMFQNHQYILEFDTVYLNDNKIRPHLLDYEQHKLS